MNTKRTALELHLRDIQAHLSALAAQREDLFRELAATAHALRELRQAGLSASVSSVKSVVSSSSPESSSP